MYAIRSYYDHRGVPRRARRGRHGAGGLSVGVTAAGAIVSNTSNAITEAAIMGGSSITGPGPVEVTATDSSDIDATVIAVAAGVAASGGGAVTRITSYNVCYTKLLR